MSENPTYPDRHHPVYFLQDALLECGVQAVFARDERTHNCYGLIFPDFGSRVMVWLIDNRWMHEREHEDPAAARLLDEGALVCHAQKLDQERVGGHWLPLATTPGYRYIKMPRLHDVAFVGYVRDMQRANVLLDVAASWKVSIGQRLFGDDAVRTYCGARCGINIPTRYGDPLAYDINMRVFEIAACGIPLVTNQVSGLTELGFVDGETCFTYGKHRTPSEAVAIATQHLEIGRHGRELAGEQHTYQHRAEQVMQWLQ